MTTRRAIVAAASFSLILLLCAAMTAQSGRRSPKTKAAPVPTPEPEVATAKPTPTPKPLMTLLVGMDRFQGFYHYDVLDSCVDRLNDNRAVKVVVVSGDLTWGEAVRLAKKENEAYVVRLQLVSAPMSSPVDMNIDALEYWVFAPTTAKTIFNSKSYGGAMRTGDVILNPGRSVYGNYPMQRAGREAAERILAALLHRVPTRPVPSP